MKTEAIDITAQLARMDTDRTKNYKALLDFYQGLQWEGRDRRNERRLTFNYARVFIDKITSYLMSGMTVAADPPEDTPEARQRAQKAEQALYRVYEDNNLAQLDLETEIDCAILGDACYKVIWDTLEKKVRVTAPDVQGLYAWWLGDDTAQVWKVASKYSLSAEEVVMLHGLRPKNRTSNVVEVWTATDFELYVDGQPIQKQPNPYGAIPFIIFPNLREPKQFWGLSDLPQITESQKELNRAMTQLSHILELSGNPIAVLENVEESEDIAVRPGAVWNLPEEAKAYLLDLLQGGGVSLHIDYINTLYRTMHDLSESPRSAFGGTERDLSGVALEIELQPLLQKVNRKRIIRSAAYNRRNRMILKLLERFQGESYGDNSLRIVWSPLLPQDIARKVSSEQTMVQTGVHSRRTAMDEVGIRDPEAEFKRWLEERQAILGMNRDYSARSGKSGARERVSLADGVEV